MLRLIAISATIVFVLLAGCHCQRGKTKKENPPKPPAIAPGKEMAPTEKPKPKPKPKEAPPKPKTKIIAVNEIAFERDNAIWIKNWESKHEDKLIDGHPMAWLPDGQRLLYFNRYDNNIAEIKIIDLRNMYEQSIITAHIASPEQQAALAEFKKKEKKIFPKENCDRLYFSSQQMQFGVYVWSQERCSPPDEIYPAELNNSFYLKHGWYGTTVSISSNGQYLAMDLWNAENQTWDIYLYDISGQELNLAGKGAKPRLSPKGGKLTFYEDPEAKWFYTSEISLGNAKKVAKGFFPTWLNDNRILYYINQEIKPKKIQVASLGSFLGHGPVAEPYYRQFRGRLKIYYYGTEDHELAKGFCTFPLNNDLNRYFQSGAPSPDEQQLALIGADCSKTWKHYLAIFDLDNYTLQKIKKTNWAYTPIHGSSWSPNGRYLVVPNLKKHRLEIIDIANSKTYLTLQGANNSRGWSWSPDSQYFTYEIKGVAYYAYLPNRHIQMKLADGRHALWCPATKREIQIP